MAAEDLSLYPYAPSIVAAIISVIVFTILLAVHLWRLFQTRTWFCIPFVIGAIFETLGYAARAYGHSNPANMNAYIVQTLLILLAPILFAASVYMFLGRIIRATDQSSQSMIRPTLLTKIFVGGDILCFLIQALGASILTKAKTKSALDLGKYIVLAGLILQLFLLAFFVIVGAVFDVRVRKSGVGKMVTTPWNWQRYMIMLYAVSVIITVRNVFRVAEYTGGKTGYLLANEWPVFVLDALPMAVVLAICATWYVGDIVAESLRGVAEDTYVMMEGGDGGERGRNTN